MKTWRLGDSDAVDGQHRLRWLPSDQAQSYHFKELGYIGIPDDYPRILADRDLFARIASLDVTHLDGKKMREHEIPAGKRP